MPCVILLCRTEKEGVPLKNRRWRPRGWLLTFAPFTFFLLALTYLLISSLDFLFLSFLPFGVSYFLIFSPTLSLYPHPFRTFYLPWKTAWLQISIYYLLPSRTGRKYRCHPFPPFIFIPIPIFLSFLLVRKFSFKENFQNFHLFFINNSLYCCLKLKKINITNLN